MRQARNAIGTATGKLSCLLILSVGALLCTAGSACALPEGRVYEMVSPPYKGGYSANVIDAVALDGESVAYGSYGAFEGAPASPTVNGYMARRLTSGWLTVPLVAPAAVAPFSQLKEPIDYSPTLESTLVFAELGTNEGSAFEGGENEFFIHPTDLPDSAANFEPTGVVLKGQENEAATLEYRGASPDFSHVVFLTSGPERLLPEAIDDPGFHLYDLAVRGENAPALRLVGLNDNNEVIDPYCGAVLGAGVGKASKFNAIADGGSEIFFTTNTNRAYKSECDGEYATYSVPNNPAVLFARLGGERTLQVSAPLAAECAVKPTPALCSAPPERAEFVGANEAGTRVFFTTSQALVGRDTDDANDLYMAKITCPGGETETCAPAQREVSGLVQVSHDPNAAEVADVQGVLSVSPDGSHVYFVARGVLNDEANAEGRVPVSGADNLYVYDAASEKPAVLVAELCSGPEASGLARDADCPSNLDEKNLNDSELWLGQGEEQMAGDGRFLLFSSYGRLVANDMDEAKDVYRYDAETGALTRVSIGEAGYDANGNNNSFGDSIPRSADGGGYVADNAHLATRAISEDGTRVVFTSSEPLSPHAINGLENIYEWNMVPGQSEGEVSLVSTGDGMQSVNDVVMDPSGRNIFFVTSQGLVRPDTDNAPDVYDARLDGGFPAMSAPEVACSGDGCQGPLQAPVPMLVPGSALETPGDNLAAPIPKPVVKTKAKKKSSKTKTKKKKSRNTRVKGKTGRAAARSTRRGAR
jgi:hypothetical protein